MKEKIGLIGVGNMGTAILEGLFQRKMARPNQIWVYDKFKDKTSKFARKCKVHQAASSRELVEKSQIILLAIKPQDLFESAGEFKEALKSNQTVISILAGTPISKLRQALGSKAVMIRAMPNLGAKVGEAMTAITGTKNVSLAEKIFSSCGKTLRLKEDFFDLVTALSGSGPAYFFLLMELIEKMGIENGLDKTSARLLAKQTALGAARLAHASPLSHEELRIMVTSKGGTTEAALKVLENKAFHSIVREALIAACEKSKELSQK